MTGLPLRPTFKPLLPTAQNQHYIIGSLSRGILLSLRSNQGLTGHASPQSYGRSMGSDGASLQRGVENRWLRQGNDSLWNIYHIRAGQAHQYHGAQ